jgi:hypothetical protein
MPGPTVSLIFPYRPSDTGRDDHYEFVKGKLLSFLGPVDVIEADSGHESFNRGASRNVGVHRAAEAGADVVVICDADTVPERESLLQAVEAAAQDGVLHLPYTYFKALNRHSTKLFKRNRNPQHLMYEDEGSFSTGGILVISTESYLRTGGMPALSGWGFEDTIFRIIVDAVLGPTKRHVGTIYHCWHRKEWALESDQYAENARIAAEFVDAEGDPQKVQQLIQKYLSTQEVEDGNSGAGS